MWYTVSQFARDRTRERGSRAFFIAALFVFRSGVTGVEQARSHTPVFWRFRRVRVFGAGFCSNADASVSGLKSPKFADFDWNVVFSCAPVRLSGMRDAVR